MMTEFVFDISKKITPQKYTELKNEILRNLEEGNIPSHLLAKCWLYYERFEDESFFVEIFDYIHQNDENINNDILIEMYDDLFSTTIGNDGFVTNALYTPLEMILSMYNSTEARNFLLTDYLLHFINEMSWEYYNNDNWKRFFNLDDFPFLFVSSLSRDKMLKFITLFFTHHFFGLNDSETMESVGIIIKRCTDNYPHVVKQVLVNVALSDNYFKMSLDGVIEALGDSHELGDTFMDFYNDIFVEEEKYDENSENFLPSERVNVNHIPDLITDETLMSLNRIEIKNRIGKVLYKGEAREKGKIYNDTIQKYISEVTNGNKKYDMIDAKKVLQPFKEEISQKLNYLQFLLQKSKQSGFIDYSYENETTISQESEFDNFINILKNEIKVSSYISQSQYIGSYMQTLLGTSSRHQLFHIYIKNTDEIIEMMRSDGNDELFNALVRFRYFTGHQRKNNQLIQLGFVRFHTLDDNSIWINTIQTDLLRTMIDKDDKFGDERYNELYRVLISIVMKYFLNYMNSKNKKIVIIPTSNTRGALYGEKNKGFTYGYDELPKLFGFEKSKIKNTNIMKDIMSTNADKRHYNDIFGNNYKEIIEGFNVWIRTNLNEGKNKDYNDLLFEFLNGKIDEKTLSQIEIIKINNLKIKLLNQ